MRSSIISLLIALLLIQPGFAQGLPTDSLVKASIYKLIRPSLEKLNQLQTSDSGFYPSLPAWGVFSVYLAENKDGADSVTWISDRPELSVVFAQMKQDLGQYQWKGWKSTEALQGNRKRLVILPIMILPNVLAQQKQFSVKSVSGLMDNLQKLTASHQQYQLYLLNPFEIYVFEAMSKTASVSIPIQPLPEQKRRPCFLSLLSGSGVFGCPG